MQTRDLKAQRLTPAVIGKIIGASRAAVYRYLSSDSKDIPCSALRPEHARASDLQRQFFMPATCRRGSDRKPVVTPVPHTTAPPAGALVETGKR